MVPLFHMLLTSFAFLKYINFSIRQHFRENYRPDFRENFRRHAYFRKQFSRKWKKYFFKNAKTKNFLLTLIGAKTSNFICIHVYTMALFVHSYCTLSEVWLPLGAHDKILRQLSRKAHILLLSFSTCR